MDTLCQPCTLYFIGLILFHRLGLLAFHTALVNSPQDAQVIKAFAALMHFGTWDSAVEFLKQDVGAPAIFVPEALGPSQAKLDDNLMKQISQLASLVNSSVDTFTCLDSLKQSLARHSKASQFSGVVSITIAYFNSQSCIFMLAVFIFPVKFIVYSRCNLCCFPFSRLNQQPVL
jgi:hypothetical protein